MYLPISNKNTSIPIPLKTAVLFSVANHPEILNATEEDVASALESIRKKDPDLFREAAELFNLDVQEEPDSIKAFLDEECERVSEEETIPTHTLYDRYIEWCVRNHERPAGLQHFGRRLRYHWGDVKRTRPWNDGEKRPMHYAGIRWVGSKD